MSDISVKICKDYITTGSGQTFVCRQRILLKTAKIASIVKRCLQKSVTLLILIMQYCSCDMFYFTAILNVFFCIAQEQQKKDNISFNCISLIGRYLKAIVTLLTWVSDFHGFFMVQSSQTALVTTSIKLQSNCFSDHLY